MYAQVVRALPLETSAWIFVPQETRSCADNRSSKVERAGQRVVVTTAEVPVRVEAGRTGQKLIVEESGWQRRHRRVDVQTRSRVLGWALGCKWVGRARCASGKQGRC